MAEIDLQALSESESGRPIAVAAVATPGTLIHTAEPEMDGFDRVWLWAVNVDSGASTVLLTLELGGVTTADTSEVYLLPQDGECKVLDGAVLTGGREVRAFAASANDINIRGHVLRYRRRGNVPVA